MKFTSKDLGPSRNMLKALGKGEWRLEGMEVLAFADMMKWFAALQKTIEMEVEMEVAKAEEQKRLAEQPLVPKEVSDPVKPLDLPVPQVTKSKSKKA